VWHNVAHVADGRDRAWLVTLHPPHIACERGFTECHDTTPFDSEFVIMRSCSQAEAQVATCACDVLDPHET